MAHGYYNLDGEFVPTASREEATAAWRAERGYDPIGVFDMGDGEVIDTRGTSEEQAEPVTPLVPQTVAPAIPNAPTNYDVQGIQSLAPPTTPPTYNVQSIQSPPASPQPTYDVQSIQGTPQQPQAPS